MVLPVLLFLAKIGIHEYLAARCNIKTQIGTRKALPLIIITTAPVGSYRVDTTMGTTCALVGTSASTRNFGVLTRPFLGEFGALERSVLSSQIRFPSRSHYSYY